MEQMEFGSKVKITVIIPVYNAKLYIQDTLDSIFGQDFSDYEIIFVDDASTDGSLDYLTKKCADQQNVKIISNEVNKGAAHSRNMGFQYAAGEYVIFLDADDYFYPHMLSTAYGYAKKFHADMVSFGREQVEIKIDEEGEEYTSSVKIKTHEFVIIEKDDGEVNRFSAVTHVPWSKLVKRSLLLKYRILFQDLPANNDVFYSLASAMVAEKIVVCKEVLVRYYYGRKGSLTSSRRNKRSYIAEAAEKLFEFAQDQNVSHFVQQGLYNHMINEMAMILSSEQYVPECRQHVLQKIQSEGALKEYLKIAMDQGLISLKNQQIIEKVFDTSK